MRFIKLQEPSLRNVPSKEEAMRYEKYMHENVTERNKRGMFFNGLKYFDNLSEFDKRRDLAYVLETVLLKWKHKYCTYSLDKENEWVLVYDADGNVTARLYDYDTDQGHFEFLDEQLHKEVNKTLAEYMKNSMGSVGHFPYSGKRTIFSCNTYGNIVYSIVFDPDKIYPPIEYEAFYEAAESNNPKRMKEKKKHDEMIAKREMNSRLKTSAIAAAAFLIACLLKTITGRLFDNESFLYLFAITQVIIFSIPVAIINIKAYFREKEHLADILKQDTDKFHPHHFTKKGGSIYLKEHQKVYNEYTFARDAVIFYKYCRYMQLWDESIGNDNAYDKHVRSFLQVIEPYVTEKSYFD